MILCGVIFSCSVHEERREEDEEDVVMKGKS